jgi:transcriptional regulator with XRE-family HTH domain
LTAFLLRRQRKNSGLSLYDVQKRLGAKSHNIYARYEQGRSIPSIVKLYELLSAVSPDRDFILTESHKNEELKSEG